MILKRIGPLSVAKIAAVLYAVMGLFGGIIFALVSLAAGMIRPGESAGPFASAFGLGAIIWLPILYGCLGFVVALIAAALYNWVAGWVGGITLELEAPAPGEAPWR